MHASLPTRLAIRHPLTGYPIRPAGFRKPRLARGEIGPQPIWPIAGGDPTNDDPPAPSSPDDPSAPSPPANPADPDLGDLGFPTETPLTEMTSEQREAYWKDKARKHEKTAKERADYDDLKAKYEQARQATLSDSEKAVEAAREEGRQSALADSAIKVVEAHVKAHMTAREMSEEDVADVLDVLDSTKFLTEELDVDTDRLSAFLKRVTPSNESDTDPKKNWPDTGQGKRGPRSKTSSLASGAERYREKRGQKATPTS